MVQKKQLPAINNNDAIYGDKFMKQYASYFNKTLVTEAEAPVTPEVPAEPSDGDIWKDQNPDIAGNEDLNGKFDVEGLDKQEIEKYSEIIEKWKNGINSAIEQLSTVIKFTANEKLLEAPGSEQFSKIVKIAPGIKEDLSALRSHIEDLSVIVKLAIRDEGKERSERMKA